MKTAEEKKAIIEAIKTAYDANPPTWANVFNILTKYFEQDECKQCQKKDELIAAQEELADFATYFQPDSKIRKIKNKIEKLKKEIQ
jgi:hypothetical protein